MRLRKKTVGWLSFITLIAAIGLIGWAGCVVFCPYARGAYLCSYYNNYGQVVNSGFGDDLLKGGLNASDSALQKKYVDWLSYPTKMSDPNIRIEEYIDPQLVLSKPLPAMAAAVLVGENGDVIATYPAHLQRIKRIEPPALFPDAIVQSQNPFEENPEGSWINIVGDKMSPAAKKFVFRTEVYRVVNDGKIVARLLVFWNPNRYAVIPESSRVYSPVSPLTLVLLGGLMLLAHIILLPIWVGMDANWRGMRPFAWGILVFVTSWVGLLAYFIAHLAPPFSCPNCGEQVLSKFRRCPVCGISLLTKCPLCRAKIKPGWQYCPSCSGVPGEIEGPWLPGVAVTPSVEEPVLLRIQVIDSDSGAPCAGAHVVLQGPTTIGGITNQTGKFEAKKLDPGKYSVIVTKLGNEPGKAEIEISEDSREEIKILLIPQPGKIVGRVLNQINREPLLGARVYIDSSRLEKSAVTDELGAYELSDIPAGPYSINAEADGFQLQSKLIRVALGRQVPAEFILEPVTDAVSSEVES
ncbi:MAG: carboxypeptidase regulatory-like domain-containing protein [Armatimonadetes bacterium]|nr:carboxypeptidase regulatory-like domain-containing protein [Armatimonadota bacterium]